MPLVLAIEPDLRQAAIVKRIVREKVRADVAVVDSRDAALEAMRATVPDVLLISALLSPRDEDELIAHLRTLAGADHLQTHTIPQLASSLGPGEGRAARGLLSAFRRKKDAVAVPAGCDPDIFAEEIRSYLERAAEQKRERLDAQANANPRDDDWRAAMRGEKTLEPAAEPTVEASTSSWASPFEWKPSNPSSVIAPPESLIAPPEPKPPIATPGLMAHLRPPAVLVTAEELVTSLHASAPLVAAAPIEPPVPVADPIHVAAPVQDAGTAMSRIRAARAAMKDSGLGIRDQRSGTRDKRLGALATWARSEHRGDGAAQSSDDLRGLLTSLAVPSAVVAVGYGRGCRIRRVRVPTAREPQEAEAVGAVILSRRLLAEQRGRREQPRA